MYCNNPLDFIILVINYDSFIHLFFFPLRYFWNALMHRRGFQVRKMTFDDVTEQHRLTQG